MKDEHSTLIRREPSEATIDAVAFDNGRFNGFGLALIVTKQSHLDHAPGASMAGLSVASPNDKPVEPGIEAIDVAQPGDVAPGGDQCVLNSIFCSFALADDYASDSI